MNKILYPPLIIVGIIIPIKYNKRTVPLLPASVTGLTECLTPCEYNILR